MVLDRGSSATLGRTCALQEEKLVFHLFSIFSHEQYCSFDLDLPIECDDEYWVANEPEQAFKQPAGVPSRISYFNWMIKLSNIRAMVIRRIVRLFHRVFEISA